MQIYVNVNDILIPVYRYKLISPSCFGGYNKLSFVTNISDHDEFVKFIGGDERTLLFNNNGLCYKFKGYFGYINLLDQCEIKSLVFKYDSIQTLYNTDFEYIIRGKKLLILLE